MILGCIFLRKSRRLLCYIQCHMRLFVDKNDATDRFKYEITPSLNEKDEIKFAKDMALYFFRKKGTPQSKLLDKLLK